MSLLRRQATQYILGFSLSCVFALAISNALMDSLYSHEYDPLLSKYTYTPNTTYHKRQEGWASTEIGKHNVNAIVDVKQIRGLKVAIWGDSEVEGFQVADDKKMAQQLTGLFRSANLKLTGFSVAHSGNAFADYYFDIPKYERIVQNISAHYIIVCNLNDALPSPNSTRCKFIDQGHYLLVESSCRPPQQELLRRLSKWRLRFISYLYGKVARINLRFKLGPTEKTDYRPDEISRYSKKEEAWEYMLTKIREQSSKPITVVYCSYAPKIEKCGVLMSDPCEKDASTFASLCHRSGIGFVDLTKVFQDYYLKTLHFPRGFSNTTPSKGHLNDEGHKLVAEAIFKSVLSR